MAICLILLASVGCGTIRNFSPGLGGEDAGPVPPQAVYGGVKRDVATIRSNSAGISSSPTAEPSLLRNAGAVAVHTIDIPLSFVVDTLTLPWTIPASIDRAVIEHYHLDRETRKVGEQEPRREAAVAGAAEMD